MIKYYYFCTTLSQPMNYEETLDYIYNLSPMFQQVGAKGYKEGMENTFLIDQHQNHPHRKYKTIHVAGTNGKGSTSHLLASILQEAGYKVGLYTSPHMLDFRERIKINGHLIYKEYVVDYIKKNRAFFESIQPSFFELTTGMAFQYFADEGVDIAVIEVGLGGRLDCTNIITPLVSIITNISFDHTNLLGNTLLAIAKEKAGIIKSGVPVVIGEADDELHDFFVEANRRVQGKDGGIVFADRSAIILSDKRLPSGEWQFETARYPHLIGELGGFAQEKNAATALCALDILVKEGLNIPDESVYKGFSRVVENTGLMGRWQVVSLHPKVVMDTGHNVAGMEYIVDQLRSEQYDRLHIVFGMVNDKDSSAVLQLLPQDATYYFTQASIPRALPATDLAEQAKPFGLEGDTYSTVKEAFLAAKRNASEKDFIFVGGSTFVVADALQMSEELRVKN